MRGMVLLVVLAGAAALWAADGADAQTSFWAYNLPIGQPAASQSTLVLSNEGPVPQTARVFQDATLVATLTIPAGQSVTQAMTDKPVNSYAGRLGAYRADVSSSDVAATVFSPLNTIAMNHASRIIKLEELGMQHRVVAINEHAASPIFPHEAFIAIVATQAATTVTVTSTAPTIAAGGVPALTPGVPQVFAMNAGDAVVIFSDGDLTGSTVNADRPIAVWSGHECSNTQTSACDGLGEQIAPVEYGGLEFVVCTSTFLRGSGAAVRDLVHLVSTGPASAVTATPGGTIVVPAGGVATFETTQDVHMAATTPVQVFLHSRGNRASPPLDQGSFVHVLPVERFSPTHVVYGPLGYPQQVLQVAAPTGTALTLDGLPVVAPGWRAVGSSGFQCADVTHVPLTHRLQGSQDILVLAYGGGDNTAYWHRTDSDCLDYAVLPSGPTGLTAVFVAPPPEIQLAWGAAADDGGCPVTEYRVYRRVNGGPYGGPAAVVARTQLTWSDTATTRCTQYNYQVTAVTRVGEGPPSNEVGHFRADLPTAPRNLTADRQDPSDRVVLRWQGPQDDGGCPIQRTIVFRSVAGGPFTPLAASNGLQLSHLDRPPERCGTVAYYVIVETQVGPSPPSPAVEVPPTDMALEECLDYPDEEFGNHDADGDGVPDASDNCAGSANNAQTDIDGDGIGDACDPDFAPPPGHAGELPEIVPPPNAGACEGDPRADGVAAAPAGQGIAVTWTFHACQVDHFLVWNGTSGQPGDFVARVPFEPGRLLYEVLDLVHLRGEHRYWVQAEASAAASGAFDASRAVPSNLIDLGAACPVAPRDGAPCEGTGSPSPHAPPIGQQAKAGNDTAWPWFGALGAAGLLAVAFVAWRRRNRRTP